MTWKPATVCVREVGQSTVLFSEEAQKLVVVNESGAMMWRRLEAGLPAHDPSAPSDALEATEQVLRTWVDTGLIRPRSRAARRPRPARRSRQRRKFDIGLASVRLTVCRALADDQIWPYLDQFPECQREPQASLSIRAADLRGRARSSEEAADAAEPTFGIWLNRRLLRHCLREEIVPILKAQLTAEVLERRAYVLALHAAALCVEERLLVVTGASGSGKSTLAAALLSEGYGFAADDLVLLDADGVARGVPLRPGLKEGAWNLLPDIGGCPEHRRPDGRRVRYAPVGRTVCATRRPVGWVVVLSDHQEAGGGLVAAHPLEALEALLAGAHASGNRLTEEGFRALSSMVGGARCFRMGRMPPRAAAAALREACA